MDTRRLVLMLVLLGALSAPAPAAPVDVVLGTTNCFVIRVPDGPTSAPERVARIRTVFERRHGRSPGRLTIRPDGARRLLYLDDEFLVAVTPADALATHHESAATLAPVWRDRLRRAWEENQPGRASAAGTAAATAPLAGATGTARDDVVFLLGALLFFALLIVIVMVLRQGRQMAALVEESARWRREVGEALAQPRAPAVLPAGDAAVLPPAMQEEVVRVARDQSQVAVNEAVQKICDSVERVLAGLLEEMARGMSRPAGPETKGAAGTLSEPRSAREPGAPPPERRWSGGARPAASRPEAPLPPLGQAGEGRVPPPMAPNGGGESGPVVSPTEQSPVEAAPGAARRAGGATGTTEPSPRRGPATLEIDAFGKTYAFPMAPERARQVVAAWTSGQPVPESWLHESGITTARLQPLLDRFVLRRQLGGDGTMAYLLDTRGGAVRIALRNAG